MMRFNYTYKITYASGQCYDRWNNLDGTSRTTPLKKERDIAGLNRVFPRMKSAGFNLIAKRKLSKFNSDAAL